MDEYYIPTVFFTLFFVVDPLGLIPVFIVYLSGRPARKRRKIILRAITISIAVSLFFILFGKILLEFLGISTGSFLVAGGILLFVIAMEMLLGRPSLVKTSGIENETGVDAERDVSVFALAIPMLCGPGNIAALLMFGTQAGGDPIRIGIIAGLSTAVFFIAMAVMFFSSRLGEIIGTTGIAIVHKLMGLILSAMAVQFMRNGLASLGIIS